MNGGGFTVENLLPGEYFVAAVDTADVPEIAESPFFEAVARFATRVTLTAGETARLNLRIGRLQ
jgi:hypothetical protein